MKKIYAAILFNLLMLSAADTLAQNPVPYGFGGHPVQEESYSDEPTESQRKAIILKLQSNISKLKINKVARTGANSANTSNFIFPLRQAAGYNDPGFYDIGNYIDNDPSPLLRDYMCNQRTYNGHMGTDIGIFPYGWEKVRNNAVEIISAADGIIIEKFDGNDDKNCAFCTDCSWNAVYVRNSDGTVCWYGHMKNGSLTKKSVGSSVSQGEYLGVVGSSGYSTGPHLHFEIWSDENHTSLIDPWNGNCNALGEKTYWKEQLPYYNSMINQVTSASDIPTPYGCYDNEKSLTKINFTVGETVYLPFFVRDNLPNQTVQVKLTDPLGVVYHQSLMPTGANFYSNCWYYYYFSSLNTIGKWTFSVAYGSNTVTHSFTINSSLPVKLQTFSLSKLEGITRLFWETTEELNADKFLIERSRDAKDFQEIATIPVRRKTSDAPATAYTFDDKLPLKGLNYYRLKMMDLDGGFAYSKILSTTSNSAYSLTIMPNPASKIVLVRGDDISLIEILDQNGKVRLTKSALKRHEYYELDVQHLPADLYILRTVDNQGLKQTQRLVIK